MIKFLAVALLIFGTCGRSMAQYKFEKESDLSIDQVPSIAFDFIDSGVIDTNVDWYYEENLVGNSVEAKFLYDDHHYSVEFDTSGLLQDIEIEYSEQELPRELMDRIDKSLNLQFKKYSLHKIQKQYSGDLTSLHSFLNDQDRNEWIIKYELVIKAKKDKRMKLYEVLLDEEGRTESIEEIVLRNNDYLEF